MVGLTLLTLVVPSGPALASSIAFDCGTAPENVTNLIAAIDAANDEVANPGQDTITLPPSCVFTLTSPDFIAPGGAEYGLPQVTSVISIDGQGSIIEVQGPNPTFSDPGIAFFDVAPGAKLVLEDVVLRNGAGRPATFIANSGETSIVRSTLSDDTLHNWGTALWNAPSGRLTVRDSTLDNLDMNTQTAGGGAITNDGDLTVLNARVKNSGGGGAVQNHERAMIDGSTFSHNHTGGIGAAIYNHDAHPANGVADLTITNSTFTLNEAGCCGARLGGAIYNTGYLWLEGSFLDRNKALRGGALYNEGNAIVTNSTFYGNEAEGANPGFGQGGAIYNKGNQGSAGIEIDHTTFLGNPADGGSAVQNGTANDSLAVAASILREDDPCTGTITDQGGNLVSDKDRGRGDCPAGFSVGNPRLSGLPTVNGTGTPTLALGPLSAAFNLVSPCIGRTRDQRGLPRPAGTACDAGAFEDQAPTTPGAPAVSVGSNPSSTGAFDLSWAAATDADNEPVAYTLYGKDADDDGFSPIASPTTPDHSFTSSSPETEGTHTYFVQATDGNHVVPSAHSAPVVVDLTAPSSPSAATDRSPEYEPPVGSPWYLDTVTVTFTGSTDPTLADGSPGSGVASETPAQTFTTSGLHTATGTATDVAGNASPPAGLDVQVDADPPAVSFSACPATVLLDTPLTLDWTASDTHSGLASGGSSGQIPVDTSAVGLKTLTTPTVTDNVGHAAAAECQVRVIYDFHGFLNPVSNAPALNDARAGAQIRVAFDLAGDQGLDILSSGFPVSANVSCGDPAELSAGTPTESARGLTFTPGGGGRYSYLWETNPAWKGTCRQLIVQLDDGTFHRANFRFR